MLSPWEMVLTAWKVLTTWDQHSPEQDSTVSLGVNADCLGRGSDCLGVSPLCLGATCLGTTYLRGGSACTACLGISPVSKPSYISFLS